MLYSKSIRVKESTLYFVRKLFGRENVTMSERKKKASVHNIINLQIVDTCMISFGNEGATIRAVLRAI